MLIQCPKCQAQYQLAGKQFGGQPQIGVRCTKCKTNFVVKAPPDTASAQSPPSPAVPAATIIGKQSGELPKDKNVALSVTKGRLQGKIYPITKPRVVVGRVEADIVVDDAGVSRKHCALEVHGTTALLVDLDSANGTFVDEKKVRTCELEHLSEFRIGTTWLLFTVTDE